MAINRSGLPTAAVLRVTPHAGAAFTEDVQNGGLFAALAPGPLARGLAGDFNNDGRTDLALIRTPPQCTTAPPPPCIEQMPLLLTGANGQMIASASIVPPGWVSRANGLNVTALVGNFGGDAGDDIALVNRILPAWASIPVLISTPQGFTFQDRPASQFATISAYGVDDLTGRFHDSPTVLGGDVDRDGCDDIVVVNPNRMHTIAVAHCSAQGATFTTRVYRAGDFYQVDNDRAFAGDFNGDGRMDLAGFRHTAAVMDVLIAYSTGRGFDVASMRTGTRGDAQRFAQWGYLNYPQRPPQHVVGDFNGDGADDIALLNPQTGWNTVPVAFGVPDQRAGRFTVRNLPAADFATWFTLSRTALVGDYDGDGRADIALMPSPAGWASIPIAYGQSAGGWAVQNQPASLLPQWAQSGVSWFWAGDFGN